MRLGRNLHDLLADLPAGWKHKMWGSYDHGLMSCNAATHLLIFFFNFLNGMAVDGESYVSDTFNCRDGTIIPTKMSQGIERWLKLGEY